MSAASHEELRENYVTRAGPPSHHPEESTGSPGRRVAGEASERQQWLSKSVSPGRGHEHLLPASSHRAEVPPRTERQSSCSLRRSGRSDNQRRTNAAEEEQPAAVVLLKQQSAARAERPGTQRETVHGQSQRLPARFLRRPISSTTKRT
ncbi:unnamed protein product [Macrosiphum euphorbiae]|uniref:Uncharacterized protein n=1 Tax=Macrosiphum euphorbiae TaxID=13131 RepID=A0AAV0W3B3_9HEMI|nr:unnamed protein product [Macrosiphum euphorbiae]